MARPKKSSAALRRVTRGIWWCVGFGFLGYYPTVKLETPVISLVCAICLVIPLASKCARPLKAALLGGGLGLLSGLSIVSGLTAVHGGPLPPRPVATHILAAMGSCAAVAALFGHLGRKRLEKTERQWE